MTNAAGHELLDFGDGRRLDRFGQVVTDRPAPGAVGTLRHDADGWRDAIARYHPANAANGQTANWAIAERLPTPWTIVYEGLVLELRATDSGQVGLFPEQAPIWRWLRERLHGETSVDTNPHGPRVLNLFGYTGAATLIAAATGARVVHVDAARSAVAWARDNAELSALAGASIRWIADDAMTFVRRELRRAPGYAGIVLDPPSYGHAGRGTFRLVDDLPSLLEACIAVLAPDPAFVVLSAHTPGFGPDRLEDSLRSALGQRAPGGQSTAQELGLSAADGRWLPLGAVALWAS